MKISIITATYNSATTLRDTLESLQKQEGVVFEVLLQDGGSTDETLEIAKNFPFVEVISEPDTGLYNAMNRGIARATGDIVGILNSDDFYADAQVLQDVANAFTQDQDLEAVYGSLKYVDFHDTEKKIRYWKSGPYRRSSWLRGWMPPHPTFFVRKSVYDTHGGFNEQLRFAADYEFMLRCCYKYQIKVKCIPKILVHMRAGGVSNSSLKNRLQANKEDRLAWELNDLFPPVLLGLKKPLRKLPQWLR
jgi:glycosyltransferase involved in cell wall biosynthesis